MSAPASLRIRNAEIGGRPGLDIVIANGRITGIGTRLRGARQIERVIDASGGALIPGLIDHHMHLLGLAAQATSLALDGFGPMGPASFAARLAGAAAEQGQGRWLRATGYDESMWGGLDRYELDRIAPHCPIRVQHRTGALWIINSLGLSELLSDDAAPPGLEIQNGAPTGRLYRGDEWLAEKLGRTAPDLRVVGAHLARFGVSGVTDASASTDAGRAELLANAHRTGALPQRLTLMSAGPLGAAADGAYGVGPVKLLLDEANLPDFNAALAKLAGARTQGRALAVHCVTATELAFTLALFSVGGAEPGDRIEHGGVIHPGAADEIARLRLTVVTQPNFIFERGDNYLERVEAWDLPALYPCGSLLARGVRVAAGSDAPYGSCDPWLAIRAASQRTTRSGQALGADERIDARNALGLYLGSADDPGGAERWIAVGGPADLCLLDLPLDAALAAPSAGAVRATMIAGDVVYDRDTAAGFLGRACEGAAIRAATS